MHTQIRSYTYLQILTCRHHTYTHIHMSTHTHIARENQSRPLTWQTSTLPHAYTILSCTHWQIITCAHHAYTHITRHEHIHTLHAKINHDPSRGRHQHCAKLKNYSHICTCKYAHAHTTHTHNTHMSTQHTQYT